MTGAWTSPDGRLTFNLGDCREYADLTNDARLICTSPPYWTGADYEKDTTWEEHVALIRALARLSAGWLAPGAFALINFGPVWRAPESMEGMYWQAFQDAGLPLYCQRIWRKAFGRLGPPRVYHYQSPRPIAEYENVWTFRKPPPVGEGWDKPRDLHLSLQAVWDSTLESENARNTACPTSYPVCVPRWAIRVHCDRDSEQLVIDPFAGGGTTLLAAHQHGVRAIGIEACPEYWGSGVDWLQTEIHTHTTRTGTDRPPKEATDGEAGQDQESTKLVG